MEIRVPNYHRKFKCTADKCPDTCCAGWQIVIDEETLEKYHKYEGSFGNRLANSIDWREGVFKQYEDKRCAFLDENNLCDIYTEAGPEMFCRTCKSYPRHLCYTTSYDCDALIGEDGNPTVKYFLCRDVLRLSRFSFLL